MLIRIKNLEAVSDGAKKILEHVEAIRKLQQEIGPYNGVTVAVRFEKNEGE